jgi:hypothetical protein
VLQSGEHVVDDAGDALSLDGALAGERAEVAVEDGAPEQVQGQLDVEVAGQLVCLDAAPQNRFQGRATAPDDRGERLSRRGVERGVCAEDRVEGAGFAPLINVECSSLEGNGRTPAEWRACATGIADDFTALS